MNFASTILALEELVREGELSWQQAVLQLREDFSWSIRDCYTCGAIDKFKAAQAAHQERVPK